MSCLCQGGGENLRPVTGLLFWGPGVSKLGAQADPLRARKKTLKLLFFFIVVRTVNTDLPSGPVFKCVMQRC